MDNLLLRYVMYNEGSLNDFKIVNYALLDTNKSQFTVLKANKQSASLRLYIFEDPL